MRVKADTWNDETRLKHTVVDALEMDWAQLAKKLITEVEAMGGQVPEMVGASFLLDILKSKIFSLKSLTLNHSNNFKCPTFIILFVALPCVCF